MLFQKHPERSERPALVLALDLLGFAAAVFAIVVLPGWLLANALFPGRGQLRGSERLFVTLAGGILVAMSVGVVLGFLPHGDRGFLQSLALRGMPYVEVAMIGASLGFFVVGLRRGAYPAFARRYPRLAVRATRSLPAAGRSVGGPKAALQGGDEKP